jgi:hypothetical protein
VPKSDGEVVYDICHACAVARWGTERVQKEDSRSESLGASSILGMGGRTAPPSPSKPWHVGTLPTRRRRIALLILILILILVVLLAYAFSTDTDKPRRTTTDCGVYTDYSDYADCRYRESYYDRLDSDYRDR